MTKWYPTKKDICDCEADKTWYSTVRAVRRGKPRVLKRSQIILHYRERDEAHFWHWKDLRDRLIK